MHRPTSPARDFLSFLESSFRIITLLLACFFWIIGIPAVRLKHKRSPLHSIQFFFILHASALKILIADGVETNLEDGALFVSGKQECLNGRILVFFLSGSLTSGLLLRISSLFLVLSYSVVAILS